MSRRDPVTFDDRPPGERYFRQPGDVLRLVVWGIAAAAMWAFVGLATRTRDGLEADLGGAASSLHRAARELLLAAVQAAAIVVPLAILVALVVRGRWRRTGVLLLAGGCGAGSMALVGLGLDEPGPVRGALSDDVWALPLGFPSLPTLAAWAAVVVVGSPWLAPAWRTAACRALVVAFSVVALAGTEGALHLVLASTVGAAAGAAVLVAVGRPNRRPTPAMVARAVRAAGVAVRAMRLESAVGGRAQRYRAVTDDGTQCYVKVYAHDSRDADLLFRLVRAALLRRPGDGLAAPSLRRDVEHEALMMLLAARAGVRCATVSALAAIPDGSVALVTDDVGSVRLDELDAESISLRLLDDVWGQVALLHGAGLAHRSLRAANVLVEHDRPVLIDFGAGETSASTRSMALDVAELATSLAVIVGAAPVVESAARVVAPEVLAAVTPLVQPLALSSATRKQAGKHLLRELRDELVAATGTDAVPLERLARVRPRTVILTVTLAGAFYILLPQLANVDDSLRALDDANWWWLAGSVVASMFTYVASAAAMAAAVRDRLPFGALLQAQVASSFVNRVTPAKVGGLAVNVRFMQKAGVPSAEAVTATGINLAAGTVMHLVLMAIFFAIAGQGGDGAFSIPGGSTVLVVIAVVLAVAGVVVATSWGRRTIGRHVATFLRQSWDSVAELARSPGRLVVLLGGSATTTMAYIVALACAVVAFDGGLSFAEIASVYLGSSIIAAAAPTPGGLGAMEAALVAALTAVGMASGIAVAAVLSYRLATFWLPILPGWLGFELLQRRNLI